jgi:dienelactone hydrolase
MQEHCPGAIIGWSLGGSAAWTLAAKPADDALRAVAMFYPAILGPRSYRNVLPILVLQGTEDNVNPEDELHAFVASRMDASAPVEIVAFDGAGNAFDVPSLVPARTLHYSDPFGQPSTFAYHAEADRSAHQALETFLTKQGIAGAACTPR